jgi:hypothetical protein
MISIGSTVFGQSNHWRYDYKAVRLGFLMGINIAGSKIDYGDFNYNRRTQTGLRDIRVRNQPGITLGLITNARLGSNFDLRLIPAVSLQNRTFNYIIGENTHREKRQNTAFADIPLLLKFKSNYYYHHRVYIMAGVKYSLNLMASRDIKDDPDIVKIEQRDLSLEFAFGMDIYGDRVKLAPEIRYSVGMWNLYVPENTTYGRNIRILYTQSILLCLNFE